VATHAQRQHAVHVMEMMEAHRSQLAYPPGDERTNRDGISWHLSEQHLEILLGHRGIWQGDCSEYGSYMLKCAGLWRWSSPGWTGSHLLLLPHHYTDGRIADEAALVVFGEGDGKHEAIVKRPDHQHGNPICSSHGRPGLDLLPVKEIAAAVGTDVIRYLSIAHL
jgi:hypothetical protein